jgi:4-amino-4-deoxy-L-arabinose transferase-like glycosyltransferase
LLIDKSLGADRRLRWIAISIAVSGLSLCLFMRLITAGVAMLDPDEASFAAAAVRTLDKGGPILAQIRDNKPPGVYIPYWLSFSLLGAYNAWLAHIIGMLFVLATGMAIVILGTAAADLTYGILGCGLYWLFTSMDVHHLATKSELMLNFFLVLALLGVLLGARRRSLWLLALAGFSGGAGFLCKQQIAPILAAMGIALILQRISSGFRQNILPGLALVAAYFAGFVVCLGLVSAVYWEIGGLRDFVLQTFILPMDLAAAQQVTLMRRFMRIFTYTEFYFGMAQFLCLIAVGGIVAVAASAEARAIAFGQRAGLSAALISGLAVGCFVAFYSSADIFPSYFVLLLLPLSLGGATSLYLWFSDRTWSRTPAASRLILATGSVLALLLVAIHTAQWPIKMLLDGGPGGKDPATEAIRARSAPGDLLYVWGWHPEIYVGTRLHPATKFTVATSIVGFHPPADFAAYSLERVPYSEPGSWDEFLKELREERPRFFVDVRYMTYRIYAPLERFPPVYDYVVANYQRADLSDPDGAVLYVRKD